MSLKYAECCFRLSVFRLSGLYGFVDVNGERPCEYDYLKLSTVWLPLQLVLMKSFTSEAEAAGPHKTFAQFLLLFFRGLFLIFHVIWIQVSFYSPQHAHILFISTPKTPTLSIYEGKRHQHWSETYLPAPSRWPPTVFKLETHFK